MTPGAYSAQSALALGRRIVARDLTAKGMATEDIARCLGVATSTACRILNEIGVTPSKKPGAEREAARLGLIETVRMMAKEDFSTTTMAEWLGVSQHLVIRICTQNKIACNGNSDPKAHQRRNATIRRVYGLDSVADLAAHRRRALALRFGWPRVQNLTEVSVLEALFDGPKSEETLRKFLTAARDKIPQDVHSSLLFAGRKIPKDLYPTLRRLLDAKLIEPYSIAPRRDGKAGRPVTIFRLTKQTREKRLSWTAPSKT